MTSLKTTVLSARAEERSEAVNAANNRGRKFINKKRDREHLPPVAPISKSTDQGRTRKKVAAAFVV